MNRTRLSAFRHTADQTNSNMRRGNTIVLVAGILVLLVIIATAYVTRTGGERIAAKVQQDVGLRDDTHRVIAEMLADEVAMSLFTRTLVENNDATAIPPVIDPWDNGLWTSAEPHLFPPRWDAQRHERDVHFPWNHAPYHVVPGTNWPDIWPGAPADVITRLPGGPGNPNGGGFSPLLRGEFNPWGGPGFGDSRWLRDLEPMRWFTNMYTDPTMFPASEGPDAFSHWKHLSYIARPDNGWRIVTDIAYMFPPMDHPLFAGWLVTNLQLPVEQWLTTIPSDTDFAPGLNSNNPAGTTRASSHFITKWRNWFGGPDQSMQIYLNSMVHSGSANMIPGNFYKLNDLNSNNIVHDWYIGGVPQDRPESEFIRDTARWTISRVLADSDGDGFTDSFWWLAPTPVENGVRQIVAMSIIDNQGMLNANVATNYVRNGDDQKTLGTLPTDLALVTRPASTTGHLLASNWNVGYYDNPSHHFYWPDEPSDPFNWPPMTGSWEIDDKEFDYIPGRWVDHLTEVGLPTGGSNIIDQAQRQDYWLKSASSPLSVDPLASYTPFSLADEIELRMFAGHNNPQVYTRFEASVQGESASPNGRFLRANGIFSENAEYKLGTGANNPAGQLTNRQYVADHRHRLTLYNNVRNDIMPPWLWAEPQELEFKFDLRRANWGVSNALLTEKGYTPDAAGRKEYLRDAIYRALTDPVSASVANPFSYYGDGADAMQRTRDLAAAFAANLTQWRDDDDQSSVAESFPLENASGTTMPSRYMGMEPQPFLVEAFVGHIYKAIEVNPGYYDENNNGTFDGIDMMYSNAGNYIVVDDEDRYSAVVAVQIANPFNEPINLFTRGYQLTLMGQTIRLTGILPPGTPENPATGIFYALRNNLPIDVPGGGGGGQHAEFKRKWCDFLDIPDAETLVPWNECEMPDNTLIVSVRANTPIGINPLPPVMPPGGGPTGGGPGGGGDPPPPQDPPIGPGGGPPPPPGEPWSISSRAPYDEGDVNNALVLSKLETDTGPAIVIDRIDAPGAPLFGAAVRRMGEQDYKPQVVEDLPGDYAIEFDLQPYGGANDQTAFEFDIGPGASTPGGGFTHWIQWVRATRAWGVDVNNSGTYDQNERSPRFVFGDYTVIESGSAASETDTTNWIKSGNKLVYQKDPDADQGLNTSGWFGRRYKRMNGSVVYHQPTFFNMKGANTGGYIPDYPDKGWYSQESDNFATATPPEARLKFPFQMLHKNDEFEQVGEIYNVFLYGHRIRAPVVNGTVTYQGTEVTFSEALSADDDMIALVGEDVRANRLRPTPADTTPPIVDPPSAFDVTAGFMLGVGEPAKPEDSRHAIPAMPAGARLVDLFVCDGPGLAGTSGTDDFRLAGGYTGRGTPGLININTAPVEVMRALPNWYRAVHQTGGPNDNPSLNVGSEYRTPADQPLVTNGLVPDAVLPRVMLPEGLLTYRERFNSEPLHNSTGIAGGPSAYEIRTKLLPGNPSTQQLRGERGLASIGELFILNAPATQQITRDTVPGDPLKDEIFPQFWKIDLGVRPGSTANVNPPFQDGVGNQVSMRLSTDLIGEYDPANPGTPGADRVAGDAEEANMLFNGVSNLITTRSDTFTVYFRVRSFKQNTTVDPPVWDATNPDFIIDDSRYVMLVDRSSVNRPSDKPKILYFEKLPN